jgi:hypothetical protein
MATLIMGGAHNRSRREKIRSLNQAFSECRSGVVLAASPKVVIGMTTLSLWTRACDVRFTNQSGSGKGDERVFHILPYAKDTRCALYYFGTLAEVVRLTL